MDVYPADPYGTTLPQILDSIIRLDSSYLAPFVDWEIGGPDCWGWFTTGPELGLPGNI